MLPRQNRIGSVLFSTLSRGRSLRLFFGSAKIINQKGQTSPRFAVVVLPKAYHTSPERNTIRRRIYAIVEGCIAYLPREMVVVFYVEKPLRKVSPTLLRREIYQALGFRSLEEGQGVV